MMILMTLMLMSCNNEIPKIEDGQYQIIHDSGGVYGYIDTEVDEVIVTEQFFCVRWKTYSEQKDFFYCFLWEEIELEPR